MGGEGVTVRLPAWSSAPLDQTLPCDSLSRNCCTDLSFSPLSSPDLQQQQQPPQTWSHLLRGSYSLKAVDLLFAHRAAFFFFLLRAWSFSSGCDGINLCPESLFEGKAADGWTEADFKTAQLSVMVGMESGRAVPYIINQKNKQKKKLRKLIKSHERTVKLLQHPRKVHNT